jgi:hypothetical protein
MESLGVYSINTIIWSRLDWALNEIRGLRRVRNDVIGQLLAELVSESNQPLLSMTHQKGSRIFPVNINSVQVILNNELGEPPSQGNRIPTASSWQLC